MYLFLKPAKGFTDVIWGEPERPTERDKAWIAFEPMAVKVYRGIYTEHDEAHSDLQIGKCWAFEDIIIIVNGR